MARKQRRIQREHDRRDANRKDDSDEESQKKPEELSPAYVFLAAPACAGYTTGIVLPVTGSVVAIRSLRLRPRRFSAFAVVCFVFA